MAKVLVLSKGEEGAATEKAAGKQVLAHVCRGRACAGARG